MGEPRHHLIMPLFRHFKERVILLVAPKQYLFVCQSLGDTNRVPLDHLELNGLESPTH